MSTVMAEMSAIETATMPERVSNRMADWPVRSRSSQPMQRVPLPQAADSDPSVLKICTNAAVPGVRGGSSTIIWSNAVAGSSASVLISLALSVRPPPRKSTARISLPRPFILT
jgi:hypothetical protein